MPDRTRTRNRLLLWAGLCLVILVTLSTMVKLQWQTLNELDTAVGTGPQGWTSRHPLAFDFFDLVELVFQNLPMTVYTVVLVAALLSRRHVRPALWTVGVMVGAAATTFTLKRFFERDRPVWKDPIHALDSFSFPSGHSSGIASAMGVAIVLTMVFVRRRRLRQALIALWLSLALLVGADRIFLGVHNLSDVLAGFCVGALWVLVGIVVYDPTPRSRPVQSAPSGVRTPKRLAVVLNPIKVDDVAAFKAMVERMATEYGWSTTDWFETTIEDPGRSMAEDAAVGGADLVVVCGGDGTVRTVCAELAGTGVPVGVVPAGTGNLLARNLNIPLYLQAAVDVALNGQDRAIDLVAVSGDAIPEDSHFMVMGGMGFDAAIMEGASDQIKARIGWLAYFVAGFRQLRYPAMKVEISMDDAPFTKHKVRTVVIGNVGYLTAGIPLLPDAAIDDGVLDVVLVAPRRFLSWLPLVFRVMSKGKRVDESLDRRTGKKVTIRAAHSTPRQLDGDPIGPGREMHATCVHGRLLVRVPR